MNDHTCPVCHHWDIEGKSIDNNGPNVLEQWCHCNRCGAAWTLRYKLSDVRVETQSKGTRA